jgi:hypothetical protein
MPLKTMTITLTSGWAHQALGRPHDYRVEKVTDSIEFTPGDMLPREQVEVLCNSPRWKVTIVPYNPQKVV